MDIRTDGACGLSWDDSAITSMTPTPAGRCPFEPFHRYSTEGHPLWPEPIPDDWPVQPIRDPDEEDPTQYLPHRDAADDVAIVDELVHFARTPEWSVSMLEDIADLVRSVRDVGPDYEEGDEEAWQRH